MAIRSMAAAAALAVSCALAAQCGNALAQEPPDSVYGKLHRAALASNFNEMLSYATEPRRAEIAGMPGGAEVLRMAAALMPRTYTVTGVTTSPDGATAQLRATGAASFLGQSSQMYGTVSFLKEKSEWKVDRWEWSSDKPAAAPARAAVAPAAPSPSASPGVKPLEPECEIKPVMTDEDLRRCGAGRR
jgi:hypothetical protein